MRALKQKLSFILLIAISSIGVAAFAINRAYTRASNKTPAASSVATQQKSDLMALPIALRMNGFNPQEITRPAGNYLISVTDLTGLPDLTFTLNRENGEQVHKTKVQKEKRTWRERVRLTPGDYVLSVTELPELTCRITITAQ
jgi:hypothetical protein